MENFKNVCKSLWEALLTLAVGATIIIALIIIGNAY